MKKFLKKNKRKKIKFNKTNINNKIKNTNNKKKQNINKKKNVPIQSPINGSFIRTLKKKKSNNKRFCI